MLLIGQGVFKSRSMIESSSRDGQKHVCRFVRVTFVPGKLYMPAKKSWDKAHQSSSLCSHNNFLAKSLCVPTMRMADDGSRDGRVSHTVHTPHTRNESVSYCSL